MRQTSFQDMHCSIARALDVVGDWWSPLIIRDLYLGVNRFDDLVEDLGISRNLLTSRLQSLIAGGIVTKEAYQERPRRFEYVLTPAGVEVVPVFLALMAWGDKWLPTADGPPMILTDAESGEPFTPIVTDPADGRPLDAARVRVLPGPGASVAPGTAVVARRLLQAAGATTPEGAAASDGSADDEGGPAETGDGPRDDG